jgi:hypothetical protein
MNPTCDLINRLMRTIVLPPLLRYDGPFPIGETDAQAQFTELDPRAASFGASFYLPVERLTIKQIAERREEKREHFAGA